MGKVLGIGEILWDFFLGGKYLGGAPANFAYHCRQMGLDGWPVSRVGPDNLGSELLEELEKRDLPVELIQSDPDHPTGTVRVEMSGENHRFIIAEEVAWDYIELEESLIRAAREAEAICFGSLAQRNNVSRNTILRLVRSCPGLAVFDINLRQEFFTQSIIEDSLEFCHILKLNDEEIFVLKRMMGLEGETADEIGQSILSEYGLDLVCVTRGANGAILINDEQTVDEPGRAVPVVDTVGCGDAFCAVLVQGLLCGKELEEIARNANRVGEFVAGQPGATPPWPKEIREQFAKC